MIKNNINNTVRKKGMAEFNNVSLQKAANILLMEI